MFTAMTVNYLNLPKSWRTHLKLPRLHNPFELAAHDNSLLFISTLALMFVLFLAVILLFIAAPKLMLAALGVVVVVLLIPSIRYIFTGKK